MIDIKSDHEIEIMGEGGKKLAEIAEELKRSVRAGISTMDLETYARKLFSRAGLVPAFLNYGTPPFPATVCTSINEEIVHGIPSATRVLRERDLISIDLGGVWKGFYVDMAFTCGVGSISTEAERLISVTEKALEKGISKMYTNNKLYDISWAIEQVAVGAGYSVVRELVGHGIGRKLHEPPQVPNYGKKGTGVTLKPGMVFALEPMFNVGTWNIDIKDDDWTVATADGKLSCHFEHTVAVTAEGPQVLTRI